MQLSWVLGVWASLPIFKNRGAFQTEWTSFHLNLMYFDGQIWILHRKPMNTEVSLRKQYWIMNHEAINNHEELIYYQYNFK